MSELKNVLKNKKICKSVWFMRQAGRYLPEFRKIRLENQNFIKLCLNSKLSSEITLQPIKRFNLDSAIIFSDILTVPYALGQKVNFVKDMGPKLDQFNFEIFTDNDKNSFTQELEPVYEAIRITRDKLNKEKSLIAFIGAPWTLLVYMLGMKLNKTQLDYEKIKLLGNEISMILDKLNEYLFIHIENQINAGADVVQIFDSWAGLIPKNDIKNYCFTPNLKIVEFCKKHKISNICFPKGINKQYKDFNNVVKPDGINLDHTIDPFWAKSELKNVVLQGGLDPKLLLKSEEEMIKGATKYIQVFKDIPYIFNLGHGLLPETDPGRVKKLIEFYRNYK